MDVEIAGRHVALTDAMRGHAEEKLKHLEKYGDQLLRVRATLFADGDRQVAELVAHVRRSGSLVAEAREADMYKAIDAAMAKLEEQLRRQKDRFKSHRSRARVSEGLESPGGEPSAEEAEGAEDAKT